MLRNQNINSDLTKNKNPYSIQQNPGSPPSKHPWIAKIRSSPLLRKTLNFLKWLRINKYLTFFLGREFIPSAKRIEIDITHLCNLKCQYCNRLIDFAPAEENMSIEQIKKFIAESIAQKRRWESIFISGGEPTCHPQFLEISQLLANYKKDFAPSTKLIVVTNGYGNKTKELLKQVPEGIDEIINSNKPDGQQTHYSVTTATQDDPLYKNTDYRNACLVCQKCAMGLNCYGYYPCTVSGAIDRVFGFNLGRKSLPPEKDSMADLTKKFCRLCGHFRRLEDNSAEHVSPTWQKAIEEYKKAPVQLTRY